VTVRFGPLIPGFREAIEAIVEPNHLETILEKAVTARRLEEIVVDP
jgi:hypothetical protein